MYRPASFIDEFWQALDAPAERFDPLEHPFIELWSRGRLPVDALAVYASEYDYLALALSELTRAVATETSGVLQYALVDHAAERESQVTQWRRFAAAAGWGPDNGWAFGDDPLASTTACATTWRAHEASLTGQLATLFAIEVMLPRLSASLLNAMQRHYRFDKPSASEYFRSQSQQGSRPAAASAQALDAVAQRGEVLALAATAEAAYRGFWRFLDGVALASAEPARAAA